jgi:hypothetical protein
MVSAWMGTRYTFIYGFTSRSIIFHLYGDVTCDHCRRRAAKFRPMLGAQGLWAGRDLFRATPAVTRDLGFSGLIRRTAPFSRLLRHMRGCGGSILTRILTGRHVYKVPQGNPRVIAGIPGTWPCLYKVPQGMLRVLCHVYIIRYHKESLEYSAMSM